MKTKIFGVLVALVLALSLCLMVAAPAGAANTYYVAKTGSDGNNGSAAHPFLTIGHAVSIATTNGDIINVAPGTYTEGQIVIINDLSIVGNASNKPVIKPSLDLENTTAGTAWFLVNASVTFNLSAVVINGDTHWVWQGIRSHGNTTIDNVDFRNIQGSLSGQPYKGYAVESFGGTVAGGLGSDSHSGGLAASHLEITNSTFAQIGRVGVEVKGTSSTADIIGCTYTGKGVGDWLDYAVEAGAGATINVQDCYISNCLGVASVDSSTSAAILVTTYWGDGTTATITGNTLTVNSAGVIVGYDEHDTSVVVAHYNNIYGNDDGIDSTAPGVNAENNWWGASSGPYHSTNTAGTGNSVSDYVDFIPWLTGEYNGSVTKLNANVPDIVAISVLPTSIDYGTLLPGQTSAQKNIVVSNIGTRPVNVSADVSDSATHFFRYFLQLTNEDGWTTCPWNNILVNLAISVSDQLESQVVVSPSYTPAGAETAQLTFTASTP